MIGALFESGEADLMKAAGKLGQCCQCPAVVKAGDGRLFGEPMRCRHRLCPFCATCRSQQAAGRITALCTRAASLRFVTLTLADDGRTLSERMQRLYECFRDLRRTVLWQTHSRGSVATIEIKLSDSRRHWHVHMHILVDGKFLPQQQLKAAWHKITGDSYIVDVRAVHDRAEAATYIAKYVGKAATTHTWTPDELCEYAHAIRGRRLLLTHGSMHGSVETEDDSEPDAPIDSEHVASGVVVARYLASSRASAARVRELLERHSTSLSRVCGHEPNLAPSARRALTIEERDKLVQILSLVEEISPAFPLDDTIDTMLDGPALAAAPPPVPISRHNSGKLFPDGADWHGVPV